ncbi:response regulator transcription factor [Dyella dinghuensis]|nr:response regulator transcription factor [Dyella dinghuensis]
MNASYFQPSPMQGQSIRVAIADDHPLLLTGLACELSQLSGFIVVGKAQNSTELIELLSERAVDVVISDYTMPGGTHGDGLALFGFIRQRFPNTQLIALTMMSNPNVIRSLLSHGVRCILSKADSLVYIVDALHAALANRRFLSPTVDAIMKMHGIDDGANTSLTKKLSPRELEVVRLFVSGLTVSEIATRLHRSKQTISTQKMNAMRRLGIKRDTDLIIYGIDANLTTLSTEAKANSTTSDNER